MPADHFRSFAMGRLFRFVLGLFAGLFLGGLLQHFLDEQYGLGLRRRLGTFLFQSGFRINDTTAFEICRWTVVISLGWAGAIISDVFGHEGLSPRRTALVRGASSGAIWGMFFGFVLGLALGGADKRASRAWCMGTVPGCAFLGLFLGGAWGYCRAIREESLPRASPVEPIASPEPSSCMEDNNEASEAIKFDHAGKS